MAVKLSEKQRLFTALVGQLIDYAYNRLHVELTFGEAYRTPEQAALNAKTGKGIAKSLHTERLAIDFNLFVDGVYQRNSESYRPLGEFWKGLHPDAAWGGDFVKNGKPWPDAGHFSLSHGGRK